MSTLSSNLERIKTATDDLREIVGMTSNDTIEDVISEVQSKMLPVGVEEKDVMFYDYDGTPLYSYTKQEFLALESMPENPSHAGLTAQGWNWSLQEAQDYLNEGYTLLDIGQLYITDDGTTRIYFELFEGDILSLSLCIATEGYGTVSIDWGDGTNQQETSSRTNSYISHTYPDYGKYTIKLKTNNDKPLYFSYINNAQKRENILMFTPNTEVKEYYQDYLAKRIYKIELGEKVHLSSNCFNECGIETITFPNYDVFQFNQYTSNPYFNGCSHLKTLIFSKSCGNITKQFFRLDNLEKFIMANTSLEYSSFMFGYYNFYNIKRIVIPNTSTSINLSKFSYLLKIEYNGTSIGSNLNFAYLKFAYLKNLTSLSSSFFSEAKSLIKVVCDNVTTINNNAFYRCVCLSFVKFGNVTTIGNSAFNYCFHLEKIDLTNCTQIPTLGTNVFVDTPSDLKIIVPDDLYEEWIADTNWSTYASKIIKKSDWDALQS